LKNLTSKISKHNFYSLLWHGGFLAFAQNFIDVDTIIPSMLVDAGGTAFHVGIITMIMLGGSSFTQLVFAPWVSNYPFKKKFLYLGIGSRIFALLLLSIMLMRSATLSGNLTILMIFLLISIFSVGGSFANVSYTDIVGKSLLQESRKSFLSIRQVTNGVIIIASVLLVRKVLIGFEYPINYANMFFIGFLSLSMASFGFWQLKEVVPSKMTIKDSRQFLSLLKEELKRNKRLRYFLGFVNTQGISISILPFILYYAREVFNTQSIHTGNFLIFKVIGSVTIGFILFSFSKKIKYRYLLYLNVAVGFVLPLLLIFHGLTTLYIIFFLGGIVFAIYTISMNGVLLEISDTSNRALYTGITGAGNILPALFPLAGGLIIEWSGFEIFFIIYMIVILTSAYFVYKLDCLK
jgi:MFS family permease